eukprot:TRINITY_DN29496_c0_g1_i3.p1 TRINITY_DN29496_c0_g1~~TRINITY_DN29496_c0_g1_i3.p1  ORF type:complete len:465 (+),score=60.32 TRINITY_DN29496_c0_g1_i3:58-1452(+)
MVSWLVLGFFVCSVASDVQHGSDALVATLLERVATLERRVVLLRESVPAASHVLMLSGEEAETPLKRAWTMATLGTDAMLTFLYGTGIFYCAWLFILQFHVLRLDRVKQMFNRGRNGPLPDHGNRALRTFGQHIIVLQIYYAPGLADFTSGNAFTCSVAFLTFDTTVLYYFWRAVADKYNEGESSADKDSKKADLKINNVYMDTKKSLLGSTLVTFFAQFGLMLYYVYELNSGEAGRNTRDPGNASLIKWLTAVAVITVSGEDEIGKCFASATWKEVLGRVDKELDRVDKENPRGLEWLWLKLPILVRIVCDFVINGTCYSLVLGTVPIMLCVEGPLDFVKDTLAIFFIVKLDDIDNILDLEYIYYREPKVEASNSKWPLAVLCALFFSAKEEESDWVISAKLPIPDKAETTQETGAADRGLPSNAPRGGVDLGLPSNAPRGDVDRGFPSNAPPGNVPPPHRAI